MATSFALEFGFGATVAAGGDVVTRELVLAVVGVVGVDDGNEGCGVAAVPVGDADATAPGDAEPVRAGD
jgi:hypothetical protein